MTNKAKQGFMDVPAEEKKVLDKVFWRTMSLSSTYNFEKMQALGYIYSMIPVINLFNKDEKKRIEGYKRHFEIFNTTPTVAGLITGLTASMEKKAAADPEFDTTSINAVKVSLMGPFAGIGDSIFWGTLRIIALGIGVSFCLQGNPFGLLAHILLFNIPATLVRYYGVFIGYSLGSNFIETASKSGLLGQITKSASIVGLMTVGAMAVSMISFTIPYTLNISGVEVSIQSFFDAIFPNILPLLLLYGCYKLISKGVKPVTLLVAMLAVGIIGTLLHIW
jgi:PTS system mannose-specific IID component/fructoselysine and glucoselysine-specific PTS system IID component